MNVTTQGRRQAQRAANSVWMERLVRLGLVAYGVVHLLVAWLALELAFGSPNAPANQVGAMHALAGEPLGEVLLWIIGVGLFALALWQASEAIWGHRGDDEPKRSFSRLGSAGKTVIYIAIGISALKVAVGAGARSHGQELSERLMSAPFGRVLVGLVGAVIVVIAIVQGYRGVTASFKDDLGTGATSGASGSAIVRLGQVGYIAKGVAFLVLGGLFIWAAITYQPKKTGSLDQALQTLLDAGPGPWLLAIVAVGIGCFGLYCFAWARYPRTSS